MAGRLDGKVALVTGGASGIGRATALIFAREGAKVVVADVAAAGGAETMALIKEAGGEAIFVICDVAQSAQVEAMVAATVATYGRLDCAFNNAGIGGVPGATVEYPEEAWQRVISVNLTGVWLCMKHEIAQMLKQGGGAVVNTSSLAGLNGFAGMSAYTASKHGVIGLTKTAALEYAKANIRVNAVCPGVIDTPIFDPLVTNAEAKERWGQLQPIGRWGKPEEVGEAVVWLCSDAASLVTGHAMVIDGGYNAR